MEFAFIRAKGTGHGAQSSIREAMDLIHTRVGPLKPVATGGSEANGMDASAPFIAATSDVYGISNGGDYRVDVGLESSRIAAERVGALGLQTLPGGRYARFDFLCAPSEVIERCLAAALHGLKGSNETPRLAQYFLRFGDDGDGAEPDRPRDYRFYVPLAD